MGTSKGAGGERLAMATDGVTEGVPLSWILLFVALALGLAAAAVLFLGGDLIVSGAP